MHFPRKGSLNWELRAVRAAFLQDLRRADGKPPDHVPAALWQEQQIAIAVRRAHAGFAEVLARQPDHAWEPYAITTAVADWLEAAIRVREFVAATLAVDQLLH